MSVARASLEALSHRERGRGEGTAKTELSIRIRTLIRRWRATFSRWEKGRRWCAS
jgi:hypothetical protein